MKDILRDLGIFGYILVIIYPLSFSLSGWYLVSWYVVISSAMLLAYYWGKAQKDLFTMKVHNIYKEP